MSDRAFAQRTSIALALLVLGCRDKPKEAPAPPPALTAEPDDKSPPPPKASPQPPLPKLKADVRATFPELRTMIKEGNARNRKVAQCHQGFRERLARVTEILEKTAGPATGWMTWDEAQRDLADDFENVIIPMRMCVNCAPGDEKYCSEAEKSLAKLEPATK